VETRLLDILVCPVCKGPLRHHRGGKAADGSALDGELSCHADRLAFPIRDGIPRMLVDEARQLDDGECAS
jgi:uncharacterized protein YbaR (Trm112 family)